VSAREAFPAILGALLLGCGGSNQAPPAPGLELHNRLGEQRLGEQRYALAREAFEQGLARAEDSVRAYTGLARAYLGMGEESLAGEMLRQASRLDTGRAEVCYAGAEFYLSQYLKTHQGPLLEEALRQARQAAQLAPGEKVYLYGLGNLYTHRGNLDSAEAAYGRALALDPGLKAAGQRLASLYKYQGRLAEAEALYRRQLEGDPEDLEALCRLALLCRGEDRLAEARGLLEKAVRLDTASALAWLNLGQLYLAEGRIREGEEALARFQALGRGDAAGLLAQAEAHPRDSQAWLRLAEVYMRDGHYTGAEEAYGRALVLDPGLEGARAGLEKLKALRPQSWDGR
jgi:tetratricopeptide (TPR) repeat protein